MMEETRMKREYKKPLVVSLNGRVNGLVPLAAIAEGAAAALSASSALAGGAALAGGYAIGRVVKSIEYRSDDNLHLNTLRKVTL